MQALQPNSTLQGGKYRIIEKLGQGGFGITYLAENTLLEGKVAIKEFFFKDYCERDNATRHVTISTSGNREIVERFKQKFIKDARTIFKLNHQNIVCIHDVFEENGTAYYVMDYIEGESLGDMVKRRGAIPEAEALGYVKDAASALEYIHSKNINHLGIKPGNLVLRKSDGKVIVIDFCVAKQYDAVTSEGITTTPVGISRGYSPAEQYRKNGVQAFSPQSDVYALAATLFKLLTGNTPPEAMDIQDEGLPVAELQEKHISRPVISAIAMAMKGRHDRTQSVAEFISNLNADATVVIVGSAEAAGYDVTFTCNVPSALLSIDGVPSGTASGTRFLKTGSHSIQVTADNYVDYSGTFAVNSSSRSVSVTLQEVAGYDVTFSCNVPSAMLSIDGVASGTASGTRFLKTGRHSIQVTADHHYVDYSGTFAVNSSSRSINITLQEAPCGFSNGVLTINGVSCDMVWVEGGTFCMGATSEQGLGSERDGLPVHSVTLSGYYIGKTEVTQALWKAVMGSNPSWFKGDNLPVENVSWNDCQEFIRKLNDLTGQNFRLPTEAEWEFACRGGINSGGYRYSGSDYIDDVAWYDDNSRETTHPVAKKLPNELGIYDMSGNVWEWCNDWYGFYCSGAQINPKGPYDGLNRVYRGGSWGYYGWCCRSSLRNCDSPGYHSVYLGLRLAL